MASNPVVPTPTPETPNVTPVSGASGIDDGSSVGDINLHRAFSALQESLSRLFDERGVTRNFTVPYVEGQPMADHIATVGRAAAATGGLTQNLLTTFHESGKKGWGSGDGSTVGHSVQKLVEATIPPDDPNAIAALSKAQTLLNHLKNLLGENNQQVRTAQSQLDMLKKNNAAGMSTYDLGVALQQLPSAPLQAVSRSHHNTKSGPFSPKLRRPRA